MTKTTKWCIWKDDGDGNWETKCRQVFTIIAGTPVDNKMVYCCYCGERLKEVHG